MVKEVSVLRLMNSVTQTTNTYTHEPQAVWWIGKPRIFFLFFSAWYTNYNYSYAFIRALHSCRRTGSI